MSTRSAAILSTILSILTLVIFAVLAVIFEILILNGVPESQGVRSIGISLTCLGVSATLLGILAWKMPAFLIQQFNLNLALAILLTVFLTFLIGGTIFLLSIFISIPLAGIR